MFLNAKELWQALFNIRTLLIENEIKYSRPNRQPARSVSGRGGGLANMFFLEFWIFSRQKVSPQAPLHTYLGPQRTLGDMQVGGPTASKLNALSNNPDFLTDFFYLQLEPELSIRVVHCAPLGPANMIFGKFGIASQCERALANTLQHPHFIN